MRSLNFVGDAQRRQRQRGAQAAVGGVFQRQLPAQLVGEMAGDGQPQAAAAELRLRELFQPIEGSNTCSSCSGQCRGRGRAQAEAVGAVDNIQLDVAWP